MVREMMHLISAGLVAAFPLYALTISGTVTNTSTSAGIPNATVTFQTFGGAGGNTYVDTTNAQGQYSIASVPNTATVGRLTPAATGYEVAPGAFITLQARDTVINLTLAPTGQTAGTGTIRGTVIDSVSLNAIDSVKVVLLQVSGGGTLTRVDSTLTAANGSFTFDSLPASRYDLSVSKKGYATDNSHTNITVAAGVTDTVDLALVARAPANSVIKGAVTDSATGNAVNGARVVLSMRSGTALQPVDTLTTAANGSFSFTGLDVGTYSLNMSVTDYRSYTTSTTRPIQITTNPDTVTVNVALIPVAKGNLAVYVSSNGAALAGVSVSAAERVGTGQTGQTYTGTTSSTGWATFSQVLAASYDVTASLAGYNTLTQSTTVATNANDTLRIALAAATGAAKVVKGVVKSSAGANLAAAQVILKATRAGSPTVLTLTDSTAANGSYTITGIPVAYTTATLTISKTGYTTTDTTFSIANDTTTVNITLQAPPTGVLCELGVAQPWLSLAATPRGVALRIVNGTAASHVTIYAMNGRTLLDRVVSRDASTLALPQSMRGTPAIVQVKQGGLVIMRRVVTLP